MRLITAQFMPWLTFITLGRPIVGFICLLLQLTIVGWLPATFWALYALSEDKANRNTAQA